MIFYIYSLIFVNTKLLKMSKKSMLRTGVVTVQEVINEDGELLDRQIKHHKYIANTKEEFFIGYVSLLGIFLNLSAPCIKVYAYLLSYNKAGEPIGINKGVKTIMSDVIGIKMTTIDNTLGELVKSNLLYRPRDIRGVYYINPRYAFKGSTKDRNNTLKTIIELGCKDC